jgi:hypothetical protein
MDDLPLILLFIGYLFGVRSERRLENEIQMNIAYRWFLGLGLKDPVPDHSTLSLNRNRLKDTDVVEEIFDNIVMQGMKHRMIAGRVLISDSTHVKANANRVFLPTPSKWWNKQKTISSMKSTKSPSPLSLSSVMISGRSSVSRDSSSSLAWRGKILRLRARTSIGR